MEKFGITHRALGITSHGLRHQYNNDLYELLTGVPSPVRCKNLTAQIDQLTHGLARSRVSQDAGHTGLGISNAYIGARKNTALTPEQNANANRFRELIAKDELTDSEQNELIEFVLKSDPVMAVL